MLVLFVYLDPKGLSTNQPIFNYGGAACPYACTSLVPQVSLSAITILMLIKILVLVLVLIMRMLMLIMEIIMMIMNTCILGILSITNINIAIIVITIMKTASSATNTIRSQAHFQQW